MYTPYASLGCTTDMNDKKYMSTVIIDLVESYVTSIVGARNYLGKCKTNAAGEIFRDSVVISSLPG